MGGTSRSEWHQLRAEKHSIAGEQRNVVHDARRGNEFVGRIGTNIQSRAGPRHFPRQRPNVQPREHANDFRIVQIERDPAELGELGDLPQDDCGNAPGLAAEQPNLARAQRPTTAQSRTCVSTFSIPLDSGGENFALDPELALE
jgi:hypothetical protein